MISLIYLYEIFNCGGIKKKQMRRMKDYLTTQQYFLAKLRELAVICCLS